MGHHVDVAHTRAILASEAGTEAWLNSGIAIQKLRLQQEQCKLFSEDGRFKGFDAEKNRCGKHERSKEKSPKLYYCGFFTDLS